MTQMELLNYAIENGIIDAGVIRKQMEMEERQKYLSMHSVNIWQGKNGFWYTRMPDDRKLIKKKNKQDIENLIIKFYKGNDETPMVKTIFESWMNEKLERGEIGKGTYDRYHCEFKRFIGQYDFSKRDIGEITEKELEDFIKDVISKQELTAKAYGNMRTLINGTFRYAKKNGFTDLSISHFFGDLSLSRKAFTKKTKGKQIFMEDEIPKVINYLKEHPSIENYGVLLVFYAGIREGELSALKYSDLDGNILHISRQEISYKTEPGHMAHEVVDFTKTEAGERDIILPQQAIWIIEEIHKMNPTAEYLMQVGERKIHTHTFNDRLYRACDELKIERRSMHKIRKTYGTTLLDGGADESLIMSQMGHKDIETTRKYYYYSNKNLGHKIEQIENAIVF